MKVLFLAVQRFKKLLPNGNTEVHCKVHYIADGTKQTAFDDDEDNAKCEFEYIGHKAHSFAFDQQFMSHFNGVKPLNTVDLDIQPNPANPQKNICVGVRAA